MIPITSNYTSIDLEEYSFIMKDLSVESLQNEVEKYLDLSIDEIREISIKAKDDIRQNYSYQKYRSKLKENITTILTT